MAILSVITLLLVVTYGSSLKEKKLVEIKRANYAEPSGYRRAILAPKYAPQSQWLSYMMRPYKRGLADGRFTKLDPSWKHIGLGKRQIYNSYPMPHFDDLPQERKRYFEADPTWMMAGLGKKSWPSWNRMRGVARRAADPTWSMVGLGKRAADPTWSMVGLGKRAADPTWSMVGLGKRAADPTWGMVGLGKRAADPTWSMVGLGRKRK